MLDISIVICAYTEDRWNDLVTAVKAVQAQTHPPREIIIVIDHNRGLWQRVQQRIPGVRAIENNEQRGLSGARNSGIRAAQGEVIAFIDEDTLPATDWLAKLSPGYDDPRVLGVGGAIEPLWSFDRPGWFPEEFDWVVGCTYRGMPLSTAPVRNLIGCNMSFRREIFETLGGFRHGIGRLGTHPVGCEETEFCIRARQYWPQGVLQYEPRARVYHRIPASRASWRYFFSRCYFEGRSKSIVTRFVGARDGLASERAYTLRTLPQGVFRGLVDAVLRRDRAGLMRAGAIVGGLATTTSGYLAGKITPLFTSRLVAHARAPLYRNAYAWLISTAVSSGLGIVYWVMAARYYSVETVGLSAALISAMIFLSGVSQLNLISALNRFVPVAGQASSRLIAYAYALAVSSAVLLGLLVIAGLRTWSSEFLSLGTSPYFPLWFILSAMLWCIFNLQDSALTGLRDALWVPVENISYAIAKIILLVLFANSLPQYGIFASWMIPVVVAIVPVNLLIFRRLIPRHVRATTTQALPINPAQIVRYVAGNYAGSLFLLSSTRLLPVIVTQQAGARAGAYFFLSWTIANSLKLMTTNMATSLTVEGALDPTKLKAQGSRFLIAISGIFIPLIACLIFGAPYVLNLSGSSYSTEGTALLRLLALSAIPGIVTLVYISAARVRQRVAAIVIIQGSFCVLVLVLSFVLLRLYGITGVGFAFLASETIVAMALLLTQLQPFVRLLWRSSSRV